MGKADTPSDKHLRGVSLPLRQAGAALARAEARALARSAGGSVPPRPSPRQRAGGTHTSGTHSVSVHGSGTQSVANRNGEQAASVESALAEQEERSESGVARAGSPRAGSGVARSQVSAPSGTEPEVSVNSSIEVGEAPDSADAAAADALDTPLAAPAADQGGGSRVSGARETPQPGLGAAAASVPVGLPDFDVFDADIFETEDEFEEAEDTVADVLTPGVVVRKTPPRRDSVPHASLKRPTAEHEVGMPREAEVPRVSLVSNTGTMAPAVTLGPDDPQLAGAELLGLPTQAPAPQKRSRGWLAAMAYDVRSLRRELIPCSIIGCVLAAIVFVVGEPLLQERGLIASQADSADTPLVNPSAANQPALVGSGAPGAARGIPNRRALSVPASAEGSPARAVEASAAALTERAAMGRAEPGQSPTQGVLEGGDRGAGVTAAPAAGQPAGTASGGAAASPSSDGQSPQGVDKDTQKKRRRRVAKRRRSTKSAKSRRKSRRSPRKSTPQGPTPAESAGLEEAMPF